MSQGTARIHILLFLITVATTLVAGMWWADIADPMTHPELFYRGIPIRWHVAGYSLLPRNGPLRDGALLWYGRHPAAIFSRVLLSSWAFRFGDVWGGHSHEIAPAAPARLAPHWCCRAYCGVLCGPPSDDCMPLRLPRRFHIATRLRMAPILPEPLLLQIIGYVVVGPVPSGMTLTINTCRRCGLVRPAGDGIQSVAYRAA